MKSSDVPYRKASGWRGTTFFHTHVRKKINDRQITVFIVLKRRPNFSIINYLFNLLKFRKSIKVAYYLTLNGGMIEVFVLAKASWQIL